MLIATYKTKKALKESIGQELKFQETSMFGTEYQMNGSFSVVGPSANNRKWFATVTMENNIIKKVE